MKIKQDHTLLVILVKDLKKIRKDWRLLPFLYHSPKYKTLVINNIININRYLESTNYINGIMGLCKCEGTIYVRTNYKFSPNLADRTISRITDKTEYFDKIFYVVEPDGAGLNNGIWYQTSRQLINHIHLQLNLSIEGKRIVKQYGYDYLTSIIRKSTGLIGK